MSAVPIELCGHRLLLDPLGGVWWPDAGVLTVADLHLEKGSAAARQGRLVPPWDTIITLDRLARMIRRWQPRTVVTLGDSFHDVHGPARMEPETFARLRTLTEAARFVWVLGNHDPVAPDHLPGDACTEWLHQGLVFRHEARLHAEGELCGHHHPKAGVDTRAGRIVRPCFVASATRLMLPAMGAYTGGLDVQHPPITRLFPRGARVLLTGSDRLFSFQVAEPVAQPS